MGYILPHNFTTTAEERSGAVPATSMLADHGMDWTVDRTALHLPSGDMVKDHRAFVRSDNQEVLAVMGSSFTPLQNYAFADLIDQARQLDPNIKINSMGPLKEGRTVVAFLDAGRFTLPGNDEVTTSICLFNGHDGTRGLGAAPWIHRTTCLNACRMDKAVTFRHTASIQDRALELVQMMAGMHQRNQKAEAQAVAMTRRQLSQADLQQFFMTAYTKITKAEVPGYDDTSEKARKARDKAQQIVGQWILNLEDDRQMLQGDGNTLWTAMNSITQWANHEKTVRRTRGKSESQARSESMIDGANGKAAMVAWDLAVAMS